MSHGPSFWFDTRVYLAVSAALLLIIILYNPYVAGIGAILLYVLYRYGRERHIERQKELSAYLDLMSQNVGQASFYALQNLPLAIAIVDAKGRIHWRNSVLADWAGVDLTPGDNIREFWPQIDLERLWGKAGLETFAAGERYYQAVYKPVTGPKNEDTPLLILSITDITASETIRAKCEAAMPALAFIQIDNYDDVLKGLNEGQRSAILAEANQHLTEWISSLEGFLKKYSEDAYIAMFDRQGLERAMADRFAILDEVRSIHGGNRIPMTLSLGVAADEPTFAALAQRSQAGLDLALGRGGDQAVVQAGGKLQFYGGKAKAVEKNTRVKARIVAQAIRDIVAAAGSVLVMGHANEDFDSLGAALGVYRMARSLDKPTHVVVSSPGIAVEKLGELLSEYEQYQGIFITPAQAEEMMDSETLLFVVDTHRPALTAAPALLAEADKVIVIDHHRRSEDFIANPMLVYLEPSASSTSELVTELLTYYDDKLELTRLEASALYAGIVVDTKSFAVQTGVRTFEAASHLRRAGADPRLVRQLFRVDLDTLKHRAEIINNTEMLPGGAIIATYSEGIKNAQVAAAQAADMLLNIEGVTASFVIFPIEDGVAISARSQGDMNVQVMMEELGGGGHQTMAGAQVKGAEIEEIKQQMKELVTRYIKESEDHESNPSARS
ncbi:MAG TPA: DHH family phosphoesterase [Selenomonadales bacterium]|nr:DHH family phosphoesterase [Selenomonadales bacterium]